MRYLFLFCFAIVFLPLGAPLVSGIWIQLAAARRAIENCGGRQAMRSVCLAVTCLFRCRRLTFENFDDIDYPPKYGEGESGPVVTDCRCDRGLLDSGVVGFAVKRSYFCILRNLQTTDIALSTYTTKTGASVQRSSTLPILNLVTLLVSASRESPHELSNSQQ